MQLSTYEKELLALILATKKWSQYLLGRKFIIKTDHQLPKYLLDQRLTNSVQHKWLNKLMGFDYLVHYKPGKENTIADCLSRRTEDIHSQISI